MILYYVRHGDPIYDPDSLTPLGHKQAEALSKRFALYGLDQIYSSDSMRAQQTAQPTCERLGKKMTLLPWANEALAWQGFSVTNKNGGQSWSYQLEEYRMKFLSREVRNLGFEWYNHPDFPPQFKEGTLRVDKEVDNFMLSLGYKHDRENSCYESVGPHPERVALFAHEGFGKIFLSSVMNIPYPIIATNFELGHSSVTVICFGDKGRVIPGLYQWSNDSHLYKEDLMTGYHNVIFL